MTIREHKSRKARADFLRAWRKARVQQQHRKVWGLQS